jgi:hypothetical protein
MREPAKASATSAGTCAFIAQVRSSWPGGAELASGHEHHVGEFRQRVDLLAVEQVGLDAFDAASRELFPQALFAETGNAHDPLARRRALGELRQRRPDLSATPRTMMSPGRSCSAVLKAADGVVITCSRCSTSRKRSGSAGGSIIRGLVLGRSPGRSRDK